MIFLYRSDFREHLIEILDRCHPLALLLKNVTAKYISPFLHSDSKTVLKFTSYKPLQNLIKRVESFTAGIPLRNINFDCVLILKGLDFTSQKLIYHFFKVIHTLPSVSIDVINTENYQN